MRLSRGKPITSIIGSVKSDNATDIDVAKQKYNDVITQVKIDSQLFIAIDFEQLIRLGYEYLVTNNIDKPLKSIDVKYHNDKRKVIVTINSGDNDYIITFDNELNLYRKLKYYG